MKCIKKFNKFAVLGVAINLGLISSILVYFVGYYELHKLWLSLIFMLPMALSVIGFGISFIDDKKSMPLSRMITIIFSIVTTMIIINVLFIAFDFIVGMNLFYPIELMYHYLILNIPLILFFIYMIFKILYKIAFILDDHHKLVERELTKKE